MKYTFWHCFGNILAIFNKSSKKQCIFKNIFEQNIMFENDAKLCNKEINNDFMGLFESSQVHLYRG